jgi:hypothetical protein
MTVLSIVTVLFATAVMGYRGAAKADEPAVEAEAPHARQLPKAWSTLLIAVTVVYCVLLLAGLSYAGWFHVA